ncbi:signal transduction protein containing a membrane domain an EAL and a GGDEF domain-like protein [Shewanella sediminis HAW-EB3]|uniref:Signal transduction protein containing a membrane domain an EAL and a GGDEF domain-like protein n=1 Tax=Shewanella sediminis (strain HAW-EB3) TaxID=425104 RepID=A8FY98_SHESH|nr:bifunctional diguanylate cyclase/phosphodiesterase [Shewanella sediminis]ABV37821.1 signal transduction protein containing a membrane domain an EAL and a GGDEF domain-like protein [Shewanella sediminis HAW-EB3]
MDIFKLITPISYWVLATLWVVIIGVYLLKLRQLRAEGAVSRTVTVLLIILAIDAFRTIVESVYFGLYFNSLYGLIPKSIADLLSQPALLIIPKLINIFAGVLVILLLIKRWVPRDIHERKEALLALHAAKSASVNNENLFNSIFNGVTDACIFADSNRNIVSINQGFELMMGYGIDELEGKTASIIYESDEEYERQGRIHFNLAAKEKVTPYEANYRHKDGSIIVGETSRIVIRTLDDQILGYVGFIRDVTDRKKATTALQESTAMLSHHVQNTPLGCISWDSNLNCIEWNKSAEKIFGYSPDEVIGHALLEILVSEEIRDDINNIGKILFKGNKCTRSSNENITKDGRTIICEWYSTPIVGVNGEVIGVTSLILDITESKQAELKLKHAASVFTHTNQGITITDTSGVIIEVNDAFSAITGYARDEVIGQNPRVLQSGRHSPEFYREMWATLQADGHWTGEIWNKRKNDEIYPEMLTISAVLDATGKVQNYVALFNDITAIKEHQEQLERIAHYDTLTNLPNRTLLADRLTQSMVQVRRRKSSLAVVFLDLDKFKDVNDAYGHDVGDKLLIVISRRLKEALRDIDTLARIGGDEFVAVLMDIEKGEDCEPVLERLLEAASGSVTVEGIMLKVSASMGVAIYPQDGIDADQLLRHADQAMYVAKHEGKNCYHLFDTAQNIAMQIRHDDLQSMRKALDQSEFVLYYQPKVNMRTGAIIGAEALIRWLSPERGLVGPNEFLPAIENHVISIEVGEWVIDTALGQIAAWQELGLDIPVSVNVSALQLQHDGFVTCLAALLEAHPEVAPSSLEIEVLETSLIDDVMQVSATMLACIELGVTFALDDFGTGYSSLTYLRRLPASLIKIDQTFVLDMLTTPDDLAIVEGVVSLAKSFKHKVIAEGVETIAHGTTLLQTGCELAQGYGIARPMMAKDIPEWSVNWKPDDAWREFSPHV